MSINTAKPKGYSPTDVFVYILGHEISYYGEDTFIKVARMEDMRSPTVGADGNVTINRSANNVGTMELTIMHNSEDQAMLNALSISDAPFPVSVQDRNEDGDVGINSIYGYIQSVPDFSRGKNVGENTWVIILADITTVYSALENVKNRIS